MPFFDVPFDFGRHDGRNPPSWRPICDCELACMATEPNGALINPEASACFQACQNARTNLNPSQDAAQLERSSCHSQCDALNQSANSSGDRERCGNVCNEKYLESGDGVALAGCLHNCDLQYYAALITESDAYHSCALGCESTWGMTFNGWAKSDAKYVGNLCEPGTNGPRMDTYSREVMDTRVSYADCVSSAFSSRTTALAGCEAGLDHSYLEAQLAFWQCVGPSGSSSPIGCDTIQAAAQAAADEAWRQCEGNAEALYLAASAPCYRDGYREMKTAQGNQFERDDRVSGLVRRKRFRYDAAVMLCGGEGEARYLQKLRQSGAEYQRCFRLTVGDPLGECLAAERQRRFAPAIELLELHRRCHRTRCNQPRMEGDLKRGDWLGECLIDSLKTHLQCLQVGGVNCDEEASTRQAVCKASHAGHGCNHAFPVALEYLISLSPLAYLEGNVAVWPDALIEPDTSRP